MLRPGGGPATMLRRDAEQHVLACALGSRVAVLLLCAAFDAAVRR